MLTIILGAIGLLVSGALLGVTIGLAVMLDGADDDDTEDDV